MFIYALIDPDTKDVRYVGKATSIHRRLLSHINEKGSTRKCRWIAKLLSVGKTPGIVILEEIDSGWQDAERRWIAHYKALGTDLTNLTDGGEGLDGASEETREKLSRIRKSEWADPDIREKLMAALKSKSRSEKISKALKGKPKSKDHIAKLKQNQPGGKHSPETIEKMKKNTRGHRWTSEESRLVQLTHPGKRFEIGNKSRLGQTQSQEERAKKSIAIKGKKRSPETKERMRLARLSYWERKRKGAEKDGNQSV